MTPLQFVVEECSNHQPDGSCLGAMIEEDLSIRRGTPRPRCLVADGKRCPYFEACVLPLADMASDPRRATSLQEAVAEYRRVTKQGEDLDRQCPECGGPMRKGKRYCPTCADGRRKASYRDYKTRARHSAVDMSTVVRKTTPSFPGNSMPFSGVYQNAMEDSHPPQNGPPTVDIAAATEAVP